jgi:hypothetical protein
MHILTRFINKIFFGLSVVLLVALVITAIATYSNYGRGIGYTVLLILPIIFVTIGLLSVIVSKWWILLIAVECCLFFYIFVFVRSKDAWFFISYLLFYASIGCGVGFNARKVFKYAKK